MTTERHPNPFIRMAQESKASRIEQSKPGAKITPPQIKPSPRPGAGGGGNKIMRKSGRGR